MATTIAPYLFTEARLNIEPTYPNSTLHISTESFGLFSSRQRVRDKAPTTFPDEETYAREHLATESSIFFRRAERSPRSFLWRVLQDRRLLELQCVDLAQSKRNTAESVLTYALEFSHPIRSNGVAFADPAHVDALEVFVLTTSNELFTFTLSKGLLLKKEVPDPNEFETGSAWKLFKPSSFSFKQPYKLVAASSLELFISLHDGGLLRLDRKAGENGKSCAIITLGALPSGTNEWLQDLHGGRPSSVRVVGALLSEVSFLSEAITLFDLGISTSSLLLLLPFQCRQMLDIFLLSPSIIL